MKIHRWVHDKKNNCCKKKNVILPESDFELSFLVYQKCCLGSAGNNRGLRDPRVGALIASSFKGPTALTVILQKGI